MKPLRFSPTPVPKESQPVKQNLSKELLKQVKSHNRQFTRRKFYKKDRADDILGDKDN